MNQTSVIDQGTAKASMPRKKFDALKRRHDYLRGLPKDRLTTWDYGEIAALDWVLHRHEPNRQDGIGTRPPECVNGRPPGQWCSACVSGPG